MSIATEPILGAFDFAVVPERHSVRSSVLADYWTLTKPEVNFLIAVATGVSFCVGYPKTLAQFPWMMLLHTVLGTVLVASGPMNPTLIAAGAATAGSFVGALGSVVGTWITQRHQDRRDVLAKEIIHREALYSDFIGGSARLLVNSLEYNITDPQKLIPIYALLSRIRLSSSRHVLETAEKIIKLILTRYQQPNLTPEQIRSRVANGDDPLREFGDVCRIELDSMQKGL